MAGQVASARAQGELASQSAFLGFAQGPWGLSSWVGVGHGWDVGVGELLPSSCPLLMGRQGSVP